MSTNEWRDCESQTLPATWEEYQRARREAFAAGVKWGVWRSAEEGAGRQDGRDKANTHAEVPDAARRHYPIRTRTPRHVDLSNRLRARVVSGDLVGFFALDAGHELQAAAPSLNAEDTAKLADLLANPFDEVEQ